jgi:CBS domain-containing protein
MKAFDVMTWGAILVSADAPILQAAQLMLENRVSGLPVVDAKRNLIGIVTEADLLRHGMTCGLASERRVEEVMTPNPHRITGDALLEEIVYLMEKHRIKRLPVVDDGHVVGMVSRANLLQALVKLGRETKPAIEGVSDLKCVRDDLIGIAPMPAHAIQPAESQTGRQED